MADFQTQIEDLTGSIGDTAALTQWLTDGGKEIINILPPQLKRKCSSISIVNVTNGTTLDMDAGGEVLQVTRLSADSGGYYVPCRELHPMYGDLTNDSGSLYYSTVTDPSYWVASNSSGVSTLFVKPTTTDAQPANVYRIAYPSVAYGDSVIANFPNEAEYLVVLYAAMKGLHRLMNDKSGDLPSDISEISLDILTQSLPSSLTLPSVPSAPVMTEKSVTITGTAPTYTKPEFLGVAPTYTAPGITTAGANNTGVNLSELSTVAWTGLDYDFDVENIDPLKWFQVAGDFIQNEEDSELAGVQLKKIETYIQAYSQAMSNQVNKFNKEALEYKTNLERYGQDIQNELNEFDKESTEYKAKLQKDVKDAELSEAKEGRDIQKYSQEIQSYSAQVTKEVQNFSADLNKYTSEIGKVTESNQSKLSKYAQDIANYREKIQKHSTDYKLLQGQYAQLKQDYNQGIQMLVGVNTTKAQQREQGER